MTGLSRRRARAPARSGRAHARRHARRRRRRVERAGAAATCARGSCGASKAAQPRHELADWRLLGVDAERSRKLQQALSRRIRCRRRCWCRSSTGPSGLTVLLTQRATQLRNHAGQITFPGGRLEPSDPDVASAALREAQEEIGLDPARVRVFGYLPDHLVISGFRVTPVLSLVDAAVRAASSIRPRSASVFEVPVAHIFDSAQSQGAAAARRRRGPAAVRHSRGRGRTSGARPPACC